MAEFVGLALSIVSLLDTCVTTCNLISRAKRFPSDLKDLHIGLRWEAHRLRDWAQTWDLVPDDGAAPSTIVTDQVQRLVAEAKNASIDLDLVEKTLQSAKVLLLRGEKMMALYDQPGSRAAGSLLKPLKETKARVTWSVMDCQAFRTLVADLEKQNDRLNRVQPRSMAPSITAQRLTTVSGTLAALDQIEVKPDGLAVAQYPELAELLAMRDQQVRTETAGQGWTRHRDLYVGQAEYHVSYDRKCPSRTRTLGTFMEAKGPATQEVLIEWKYYIASDTSSRRQALSRAERIAELLSMADKPAGFRTLDCVGWFVEKNRCGLMFSIPSDFSGVPPGVPNSQTSCVTLGELIRAETRPPLQQRFRLAFLLSTSLLKLHLARWLHKNITSENVIFFVDSDPGSRRNLKAVDITKAYLASFGLSRPDRPFESSEAAMRFTPTSKAYQHPSYSVQITRNPDDAAAPVQIPRYRNEYDVYSLGCVLLEIVLWTSLEDLGWKDSYSKDLERWRSKLQDIVTLNVPFQAGQTYADLVLKCLQTDIRTSGSGEGTPGVNESSEAFCWDVVRKLDLIKV